MLRISAYALCERDLLRSRDRVSQSARFNFKRFFNGARNYEFGRNLSEYAGLFFVVLSTPPPAHVIVHTVLLQSIRQSLVTRGSVDGELWGLSLVTKAVVEMIFWLVTLCGKYS